MLKYEHCAVMNTLSAVFNNFNIFSLASQQGFKAFGFVCLRKKLETDILIIIRGTRPC